MDLLETVVELLGVVSVEVLPCVELVVMDGVVDDTLLEPGLVMEVVLPVVVLPLVLTVVVSLQP